MRSPPTDLAPSQILRELAEAWAIRAVSMEYVSEGGGSHHWRLVDRDGVVHFVTVDDLDNKDWMADAREAVWDGLNLALETASTLRRRVGLDFVVAPIVARDGEIVRRLDDRYAVSVFPFLSGRSHAFGPYADARLRDQALDMIAALHDSTPIVRDMAPGHEPRYGGRTDLNDFLLDPDRLWDGGPFSEAAHDLVKRHRAELRELVAGFDHLVAGTAATRADTVITHGEPHPANLMSVDRRVVLIDWDTVALAAPERDLALIVGSPAAGAETYQRAARREIHFAVIELYRLRWFLDDLASAVRMFRRLHEDTADSRRWYEGIAMQLEKLPTCLRRLE